MGAKKMGRPKSTNPKSKTVSIRLTEEEIVFLDECCKKYNMVRRDLIMECIYNTYIEKE